LLTYIQLIIRQEEKQGQILKSPKGARPLLAIKQITRRVHCPDWFWGSIPIGTDNVSKILKVLFTLLDAIID